MPAAIIFDNEAPDKNNPALVEAAWVDFESISRYSLGDKLEAAA